MVWENVKKFVDGSDRLDAATLNRPIDQLAARTEYLKALIEATASRTNMAVTGVSFSGTGADAPQVGQPVYRVPGGNSYAKAAAVVGAVDESKWFWADHQAMAVGIVGDASTVVLGGYIAFGSGANAGIPVADVIADAAPSSGRYFLSTIPGKLTAAPVGPIIYVCDCEIANGKVMSMLVNPQYRDTGESHVHRSFVLSGMPMGGYSMKDSARFSAVGILPDDTAVEEGSHPDKLTVTVLGTWNGAENVTYTLAVGSSVPDTTADDNEAWGDWDNYYVDWSSTDPVDGSGRIELGSLSSAGSSTAVVAVGVHGLKVQVTRRLSSTAPKALRGDKWTIAMPTAAKGWRNTGDGFALNLSAYPELLGYVPLAPINGASFVVGGLEFRGPVFGSDKQWEIVDADSDGGPWLLWHGCSVIGDGSSPTAPFEHNSDDAVVAATPRALVLHVNRMRVGPTGFVTSLQAAPGSPLKVTSAQTGANAVQGALQVGLDIDFKSESGNAEGSEVVKRIVGSTFVTGPVVERIVAGPGLSANKQQGVVTVSVSNAVYAGDFETIALKNAKQDLAGGVFPYTKLLGWTVGGPNIDSGFTAKFRVPDHIPYNAGKGYYVVVSASVFGEADAASAGAAAFKLTGSMLADQACAAGAPVTELADSIASPSVGYTATIDVPFAVGYGAFDPVLVHGFGISSDDAGPGALVLPDVPPSGSAQKQRIRRAALWLKADSAGTNPMVVYPGYFVGISIARCGTSGTPYTAPIGFLSLRWNLVAVQ